jgi:hypothetical protein
MKAKMHPGQSSIQLDGEDGQRHGCETMTDPMPRMNGLPYPQQKQVAEACVEE